MVNDSVTEFSEVFGNVAIIRGSRFFVGDEQNSF